MANGNYLDGSDHRVNDVAAKALYEAMSAGDCPPVVATGVAASSSTLYAFGLWAAANESLSRESKLLFAMALRDFASGQVESEVLYAAFDRLVDEVAG